jgi:hypothetical protein
LRPARRRHLSGGCFVLHRLASIGDFRVRRALGFPHTLDDIFSDAVQFLAQRFHLSLTHSFVEVAAKFVGLTADHSGVAAERVEKHRQILGAHEDQDHNGQYQQFTPADLEHALLR